MNTIVTRKTVAEELAAYLNRDISLARLVDWAEDTLNDGELDEQDAELLRDILARVGLADVREFGLSWDDCYSFLSQLGYTTQVKILPLAA
ncbi:MAG: hypothetical protein HND47_14460 [Chloroflexi bacterium]|nr:hypothetical protein [Chloroflexota bacterium]